MFTLRTCDDAARLQAALDAKPRRVLIIGAGFIGSEVASICRERGLEVTVAERAAAPLAGALGDVIGAIAAQMQRDAGVDLRTGVSVSALEGDAKGHVRRARLSDGTTLDVDVVLASLGSIRNVEWLEGSGLAAGFWGVACDAGCRVFDIHGLVTNHVFVAGDIARSPHVLYDYQFLATEFWGNAVYGAEVAAHNMVCAETDRRPHLMVPVLLVRPVRRQYQDGWCAPLRGRDRLYPGLRQRPPVRRRLRPTGTDCRCGHLQPRQMAAVLRGTDRTVGSVPAPVRGIRCSRRCEADAGRFPTQRRSDGDSRCRPNRSQPERKAGRVPPAQHANDWRQ